jgi:hypothetical protein
MIRIIWSGEKCHCEVALNLIGLFTAVRAVWETLAEYVSEGEMEDIAGVLPKQIQLETRSWLSVEKE